MEKELEDLRSIDPSDSMAGIMEAVNRVLQVIERDPGDKISNSCLELISSQEERTREYYMRPFDSDDIYNTLIKVHQSRGENGMVERYRRCLDLRQARKWTIIGDSYALLGLNGRAVKFLKRALFFGPSEDIVDEVQRAHDKALKRVEKAESEIGPLLRRLDADPQNQRLIQKALTLLIDLDRLEEADEMINRLSPEGRSDPDQLYKHGCILFGMDDFERSKETFNKVLETTPNSTNAKRGFNLAEEMIRGIN